MKGTHLGEFEEIVLLSVGVLFEDAYGVSIKKELEERLNRKVSVGALHSALKRLVNKGFLLSELGEASPQRGGKRKRYFKVTVTGFKALQEVKDLRNTMWDDIPRIAFDFQSLFPGLKLNS